MLDRLKLAERIRTAMNEAVDNSGQRMSRDAIADAVGVTKQAANGWITTGRIGKTTLAKLANVTGKDLSYFLDDVPRPTLMVREESAVYGVSRSETPDGYLRIDRIAGEAAMGYGIENGDFPEIIDSMVVAKEEIRRQVGFVPKPGRLKLMTGRGDSLPGVIEPGQVVWVDTAIEQYDGDGVYLINTGFGQQFKILQAREVLYVVSTNRAYPEYAAPIDMIIGGKVIVNMKISRMS